MADGRLKYQVTADVAQMKAALVAVGSDIQELTRKLKEQAKTGTVGAQEMIAELQRMRTVMGDINRGMRSEVGAISGNMGALKSQVQNAAFQFGDFAVQVAGGTSASRAMAQQLPQLLGALGMWGAVFGAASAALIPFIASLFDAGDGTEEAEKQLKSFMEAMQSYINYAETAGASTDALRKKFGEFSEPIRENARMMAQVTLGQMRNQLAADAAGLSETLNDFAIAQKNAADAANYLGETVKAAGQDMASDLDVANARDQLATMEAALDSAAGKFGLSVDGAKRLSEALQAFRGAQSMEDVAQASQNVLLVLDQLYPTLGAMPEPVAELAKKMFDLQQQAAIAATKTDELSTGIDTSVGLMHDLVAAAPDSDWLSGAIAGVEKLAESMRTAQSIRLSFPGVPSMTDDSFASRGLGREAVTAKSREADRAWVAYQYSSYGQGQADAREMIASGANPLDKPSTRRGGVGGGQTDMDRLRKSAVDAMALVGQAQGVIAEKVRAGLMTTAEGVAALHDAKTAAANDMAELAAQFEAQGTEAGRGMAERLRTEISVLVEETGGMFDELSEQMSAAFTEPFADFLTGTKSAEDALSSFGNAVMRAMANAAAASVQANLVAPIFSGIGSWFSGLFAANGAVVPYAKGGVPSIRDFENMIVGRPTMFAMGGGATGIMGEAGKEAIMPLEHAGGFGIRSTDGQILRLARMADGVLGVDALRGISDDLRAMGYGAPALDQIMGGALGGSTGLQQFDGAAGSSATVGRGASMVVNIQPPAGYEAVQQTRQDGGTDVLDVTFRQMESRIAANIVKGQGAVPAAIAQTFNLKRSPK